MAVPLFLNPLHDPTDPVGRLLFTTLSMIAEFEADLARARTREGMAVARAKGRLRGKQPKLSPKQEAHLVELYRSGDTLVVTKLDRLARSVPNARDIIDELPPAECGRTSAARCTTPPIRSGGSCSPPCP